ncbi:MAG: hypothetical protein DME33_09330 [Verrucomicrobia bacterium]|nr:MAG: hypothetical protein DME33_09330 [Verrucomicrobiota bacterium]
MIGATVIILTLFSSVQTAQAAVGDLDPTFGTGGMVTTDLNHTGKPIITKQSATEQYATADDGTPLHWQVVAPMDGQKHPAVLLLPGGGFKHLYSIPAAVSSDLRDAGYCVFNFTEYRLAPPNKLAGQVSDGRFPDQTNDVELAAAKAKTDSRCNGEVFAVGGSAGATHAAWLAGKSLVKAAVLMSPAMQFDDIVSLQNSNFRNDVINYAPGNLAAASPNNILVTNESAIFITAFQHDSMPAPQYNLGVAKLASLGTPNRSELVSGQGHSWDLWPLIKDQAIKFLNTHRGSAEMP